MDDEALWKRRFLLFTGARVLGLAMMLLGIVVAYSDLVREGGWPAVGAVLVVMGAIDTLFAPKMLKKYWEQEDREAGRGGR